MKKIIVLIISVFIVFNSLHTYSEESSTLTVKSKHWISKRSFTQSGVDYFLDVYVVDDKSSKPKVNRRNPDSWWKLSGLSEYYLNSLSLTGKLGEVAEIKIPKGRHVYLSSHFRQGRGFLVDNVILYCETLVYLKPDADEYVLDLNFVTNKAATKFNCSSQTYTPQEYALSHSSLREKTVIDGLSRKVLSLSYGDQLATMFTALEISQQNDYLPVYLDATVDRLYAIGKSKLNKHEGVDTLIQMLVESASDAHIAALGNIAKHSENAYIKRKLKKFLPNENRSEQNSIEAYQPRELEGFGDYTVEQLRILSARENLNATSKYELEAAARSIMSEPEKYDFAIYDKAANNLQRLVLSKDREAPIAAIWMVRAIEASKNKKYLNVLSEAENKASHRKLKSAIRKAVKSLNTAIENE